MLFKHEDDDHLSSEFEEEVEREDGIPVYGCTMLSYVQREINRDEGKLFGDEDLLKEIRKELDSGSDESEPLTHEEGKDG